MTRFDYPPSRTLRLGDALDRMRDAQDTADAGLAEDARGSVQEFEAGLEWAVEEFGTDAEIELHAIDTGTRARIQDHIQGNVVGDAGSGLVSNYVLAACIDDAPFVEDGDDLDDRAELVSHLPPQVTDWLGSELDDLSELTAGN